MAEEYVHPFRFFPAVYSWHDVPAQPHSNLQDLHTTIMTANGQGEKVHSGWNTLTPCEQAEVSVRALRAWMSRNGQVGQVVDWRDVLNTPPASLLESASLRERYEAFRIVMGGASGEYKLWDNLPEWRRRNITNSAQFAIMKPPPSNVRIKPLSTACD